MMLYISRHNDHEYSVTTNYAKAIARGEIVEQWPINTVEQCNFLGQHGSAFLGAAEKVSRIGYAMATILEEDPDFRSYPEFSTIEFVPAPELTFWQRLKAVFA